MDEALSSIAAQTCQNFRVYVGDDASPHDLAAVCRRWQEKFPLLYQRFDHNLGGSDLVAQWHRCINLSREPWVWLFSDDDVMESGCVQAFYDQLEVDQGSYELYHFDVQEIDSEGVVRQETPSFPDVLGSYEFALKRFNYQLSSFAPDYIFSREALHREGGFQPFPLAWCSDDATWIKLAMRKGIKAIRGPRIRWRNSGINISSSKSAQAELKFYAAVSYLVWLESYLTLNADLFPDMNKENLTANAMRWLFLQMQNVGRITRVKSWLYAFLFIPAGRIPWIKLILYDILCKFSEPRKSLK